MPTTCKLKADTGKLGHHPDLQEDRELADVVRPRAGADGLAYPSL